MPKKYMKNDVAQEELLKIMRKHKGILKPEHVILEAQDEDHPLHDRFQWDDSKAGHEYRLWQARHLIGSVELKIVRLDPKTKKNVEYATKQFVSLPSNRKRGVSGYSSISEVMNDADKLAELEELAIMELKNVKDRYSEVQKLKSVWSAIEKVEAKVTSAPAEAKVRKRA